ncbi:MAG: tetratricopeptide repeat protein [Planctomycetaceae bacterium]
MKNTVTHPVTSTTPTGELLSQAVAFQRQGELGRAERLYRELLKTQPDHRQARGYLAGILLATQRPAEAEPLYRQSIAEQPDLVPHWLHLATSLQLQNKLSEACELLSLFRGTLIGEQYQNIAHLVAVEKRLGELLYHLGRFADAQSSLEFTLRHHPQDAFAWELLGCVNSAQSRPLEAENCFRRALTIESGRISARYRLAECYSQRGDDLTAERELRILLEQQPTHAPAWCLLGSICYRQDRPKEAGQAFHQAVMLKPDHAPYWSNWGASLHLEGDLSSALRTLEQALKLQPLDCAAWTNRAAVMQDCGRFDDAERCYKNILSIKPEETAARHNRALLWLLQGDDERGLPEHEFRGSLTKLQQSGLIRHRWNGKRLTDERLVIRTEQGVGDEVMWARYFPLVLSRVQHCRAECDPRLVSLFNRSFPQIEFVSSSDPRRDEPKYIDETSPHPSTTRPEVQIPLASLPNVLGLGLASDLTAQPYLHADESLRHNWRTRLQELPARMRVGISWFGGGTPLTRRKRSIALPMWHELMDLDDVAFVNLQYGPHRTEGTRLVDWDDADPTRDLDNFSALVAELDLVISVDNSTVHLAGALGVPVWVFLPAVPDWRWGLRGERTDWYPSAMLFRQTQWGNWSDPIRLATMQLKTLLTNNSSVSSDASETR